MAKDCYRCGTCGGSFNADDFYWRRTGNQAGKRITRCKPCYIKYNIEAKLKSKYGLTQLEYNSILESQNGGCAICGTFEPGGRGSFPVDHDHACCPGQRSCGKCIRGLLCTRCNVLLAMAGDCIWRLTSAISYLQENRDGR